MAERTGPDPLDEILPRLQAAPESEEGWSALYRVLWPFVLATAHRTLGVQYASYAPDVAQEVFLQLARAPVFSRFVDSARLRGYVSTITRHRAYDLLRREGKIASTEIVEELLSAAIEAELEETYETHELLSSIRSTLSEVDRDLLNRVLLGYSAPEIARQIDITAVAARVRLHRLRQRIQTYLDAVQGNGNETPEV